MEGVGESRRRDKMRHEDERAVSFRRSSACNGGMCVEVALSVGDNILVRDAKDGAPDAPVLRFTKDEWEAFVVGVHAGEFSHDALLASL